MQTDPKDCLKGLKLFDLYGENIFVKGIRKGRSNRDNFFTVGMSFFEAIILGKFMWDINAQPTMFSSTTFKKWLNPPDDFALDLYAYYFALKNKIKIYKFPVKFDKRAYGISHWNINFKSKLFL